jgi:hypothetical protein
MKLRKVIEKRLRHEGHGLHVGGNVNAVIAANVNESGRAKTRVSSRQHVVQRAGRTEVFDDEEAPKGEK